jgi:CheY-like chemotaxis protein
MKLEKIPFRLGDVLKACESVVEAKAKEKNVLLYLYSEPFVGKKLVGDPTKLRQILINLLSNAIKFTERGKVSLMAQIVDSSADYVTIRFETKDSGIGMTPEQINSVFELFTQADISTARFFGGTGLGLPLTKNLVELMGGEIKIDSVQGVGSKFSFELKFKTVSVSDKVESKIPVPVVQKPTFSGDVLVCEDNRINQEVIVKHLEQIGLNATVAENGKVGVELAQRRIEQNEPFILILMDINMPIMDGMEATQNLIALGNKSPIIALTANAIETDRKKYLELGMSDYLSKPYTTKLLWECLLRHLKPISGGVQDALPIAEETPAEPSDVMILDTALGLERTMGDAELYARIQKNFTDDYHNIVERLDALLQSQNTAELYRLVHTVKSASRLIGAEQLADIALEMELTVGSGVNLKAEQIFAFKKAWFALSEILFVEQTEPDTSDEIADFDAQIAAKLIGIIEPLIKSGLLETVDYIEEIKTVFAPLGEICDNLVKQIEEYEFDSAYSLLLEIKERARRAADAD